MNKQTQESVAAAEVEIAAILAADVEAKKSVAAAPSTDDQIQTILAAVAGMQKSIETLASQSRGPGDEGDGEGDGEGDEGDEGGGETDTKATFLRKSLAELDPADGSRDPGQTALDVSRWLDGAMGIVKEQRVALKSFTKSVDTRLTAMERQIGLLLQLSATQAKKSLETTAAAGEVSRGRGSHLSVLAPAPGLASETPAPGATPAVNIPLKLKSLAVQALKKGLMSQHDVALVESYVNGSGEVGMSYGGAGPSMPPKHLMDIMIAVDQEAAA